MMEPFRWNQGASGAEKRRCSTALWAEQTAVVRRRTLVAAGGLFVERGYLGTTLAVLPQGAEQFLNADACRRAGAALALLPEEASSLMVDVTATRLLTEPVFTAAARAVQAEIASVPSADEVLVALTT